MEKPVAVTRRDPVRVALQVLLYLGIGLGSALVVGPALLWLGGQLMGAAGSDLVCALFVNWLLLRMFTTVSLPDLGLRWSRLSADNLALGMAGGVGAACLVLGLPVLVGAARFVATPADQPSWGTVIFVSLMLAAGSGGEEIFFRGFGFQVLLANFSPVPTIVPVGLVFALLHSANPHATWPGIANTAGFGILFGYAYLRSRDIWLPIGLHFGWNVTLPIFGANVSGLRMKVMAHEMAWTAGKLWSGGGYGPEASILASAAIVGLFFYVWKAPVSRQHSPLTDVEWRRMNVAGDLPTGGES
ncbi:MAG TPA: type II CAAX endopeptidase family protein [Candidatus Sulfopaludibacter sp.]|nr:type II CAAX endopeptidase family protein [Candidatus Sulfopaludibacter sp.]